MHANSTMPTKKAPKRKRKDPEQSPLDDDVPSSSSVLPSIDPHPSKRVASASQIPDMSAATFNLPLPCYHPAAYTSPSSSTTDPTLLIELQRLTQQLDASREDLVNERRGRDVDRMLYEQQIAALKDQRDKAFGWKGKGRE